MTQDGEGKLRRMICFQPIGYVKNNFEESASRQEMLESSSRIVLDKRFVPGLEGLEAGQSLLVIFHFDRTAEGLQLRQHPQGDPGQPKRGVFSLRSPLRPNAIGATRVRLLGIEGNVLRVQGLDAYNETPVLDLKPAID